MRGPGRDKSLIKYVALIIVIICGFVFISGCQNTSSGSKKSGDIGSAEFSIPSGIAVDSAGNVYVVDSGIDRIQKFGSDGNHLLTWGSPGTGLGEFDSPNGIAVDSAGNVYVADTGVDRIQKFSSDGTYLSMWGAHGKGLVEFDSPNWIAVDSAGNVYVVDSWNYRIQKYTEKPSPPGYDPLTTILTWGSYGNVGGTFSVLEGIAVDSAGNVYVVDHPWIQKFSSDGTYLLKWGSYGNGPGEFAYPHGIAVDTAGNVYVADTGNDRIQKFSSDGTYLSMWGSNGKGPGEFNNPRGIAVDSAGNVYVTDTRNYRIQKFSSDGTYLLTWGYQRNFTELQQPTGIKPKPVCTPPVCYCGHLECKENCEGGCGYVCVETTITPPPDWTAPVSTNYQNLKIGDTAIISVSAHAPLIYYDNISVSVNSFQEYKPDKELIDPELRSRQGTWYNLQLKFKNAGERKDVSNQFQWATDGTLVDSKGNEITGSVYDAIYSVDERGGRKIIAELPRSSYILQPGIWNYDNITFVFSDDATSGLPSFTNIRNGAVFHLKNKRCLDTSFSIQCCPYNKIVEDDISWVVSP